MKGGNRWRQGEGMKNGERIGRRKKNTQMSGGEGEKLTEGDQIGKEGGK